MYCSNHIHGWPKYAKGRLRADPEFLALHFRARLVRVRGADPPLAPAVTLIRSPLRDRSYSASIARPIAPHTDFRNTGTQAVRLCGVGTFLSAIKYRGRIDLWLRVFVGGGVGGDAGRRLILEQELPPQEPARSFGGSTGVLPLDAVLLPGEVVSAQVHVLVNASYVFDAALFVLVQPPAGVSIEAVQRQLQPASEIQLWPERLDLNLDGAIDNVDLSEDGEIWAEVTRVHCDGCPGAHDTQFRWGWGLPWRVDEFKAAASLVGIMDGGKSPYVVVNDTRLGQCVQLVRPGKDAGPFATRLCDEPPPRNGQFGYHADFDGDGYVDRMRVSLTAAPEAPHGQTWLSLGARGGLGDERAWFALAHPVYHHLVNYVPQHGRYVLITEVWQAVVAGDGDDVHASVHASVYMVCPRGVDGTTRFSPKAPALGHKLHCVPSSRL